MPRANPPSETAYQLLITLRDADPPIWRRVLVPGDVTLANIHDVIQQAMGWQNSHLHSFRVRGVEYGPPDPDGELDFQDERGLRLADFARKRSRFEYEYDFGDSWQHDIVVENIVARSDAVLPVCVAAERACPPEDCGGIFGFADMLEALGDPDHPDHEEVREWIGKFRPERADKPAIDRRMRTLATRWRARARSPRSTRR